jgi:hypothetical protein
MDIPPMEQKKQPDTVLTLVAFNYDLQFEPATQVVMIGLTPAASSTRYQLPFGRLEFGMFLKQLTEAWERIKREAGENENQERSWRK